MNQFSVQFSAIINYLQAFVSSEEEEIQIKRLNFVMTRGFR